MASRAKVVRKSDNACVAPDCFVTESSWERMKGLLAHSSLPEGEGLWISPCTSIHTFFMRFAIDAVFLDSSGKVLRVYDSIRPWRLSWIHMRAAGVLELPAGTCARYKVTVGETLEICRTS